jgi:hypothetical protein
MVQRFLRLLRWRRPRKVRYITTPDRQIRRRSQDAKDLPPLHYDSNVTGDRCLHFVL